MRTIYVTGGLSDYAVGTLTDTLGHDLSTASLQVALGASSTTPPATGWAAPDVVTYPAAGSAVVSRLCKEPDAPGLYNLWVRVADTPTVQPVPAINGQVRLV